MSSQGTIRRYTLIIEKIRHASYPSFAEISSYLHEHGFEISKRTLQRDIEQIRVEFGAEVKYDRFRNGYFIDLEASMNLDSFLRLLEVVTTANLLTDNLREGKESLKYISFESDGRLKGSEHLQSVLFAIKNHRKITFSYRGFDKDSAKEYELNPMLLKEYQNRWYVIGKAEGDKFPYRTFGIDRMQKLELKTDTFKRKASENPHELFDHIIGITYSEEAPVLVELSFTPLQGKYIKSLPLHPTQEILKDDTKELIVRISIIINFEFREKILMMGDRVKILKPLSLANEIRDTYKNAINLYK